MMTARTLVSVLAMAALLAGCDPAQDGAPENASDSPPGVSPMEGMEGMEGMGPEMSGRMMGRMSTHMERMSGMGGDSLMHEMPEHRQMVANMIARMNGEMRDMDMAADTDWNATVDSLRNDLIRMPEMGPGELETLMPEHRRRVLRLMEMHREMMEGM